MADLCVSMGSLKLENPLIVSSGYVTDSPSLLHKADLLKPGAIILKTSLPEKEYSQVVKPGDNGILPSLRNKFVAAEDGLLIGETLSLYPLEWWAEWLYKNKANFQTPLIASTAAVSIEGHVQAVKMMEQAGADGIEILMACPAPYFRPHKFSMTSDAKIVGDVCQAARKAVKIPLGAKIHTYPTAGAKAAIAAGLDWITIGGAIMASPGINLETLQPRMPYAYGISGARVQKYANFRTLLNLSSIFKTTHVSIHGGIQCWEDVAETILYGANTVQAQAIFMKKGFRPITEIKEGLAGYMSRMGFKNLDEMRGAILSRMSTFDEAVRSFALTKEEIVALVNPGDCNGCGLCEEVCGYDAILVKDGVAEVDKKLCEACGLCIADCPTSAISMKGAEKLWKKLSSTA